MRCVPLRRPARWVLAAMVAASGAAAAAGGGPGEVYTVKAITPPAGVANLAATGINDASTVVGTCTDASGLPVGFRLECGRDFRTFCPPDADPSIGPTVAAVNDAGVVAGTYVDASGDGLGFLYDGRNYTTISAPGASLGTQVVGLNNRGQAAGYYFSLDADSNLGQHGFVFSRARYHVIDPPGSTFTQVTGINDAGTVVGTYVAGGKSCGFVYRDGRYAAVSVPAGVNGTAIAGIADDGTVAGTYLDAHFAAHGFVLKGRSIMLFDPPDSTGLIIHGISPNGIVVGTYADASFTSHGFVYDRGESITVDAPAGGSFPAPFAANAAGTVVGFYFDADGALQSFVARRR